jgi:uncharacterized protein (DUF1800 family)
MPTTVELLEENRELRQTIDMLMSIGRADKAYIKRLREAILWSGSNDWTPPDVNGWKKIIAVVREVKSDV